MDLSSLLFSMAREEPPDFSPNLRTELKDQISFSHLGNFKLNKDENPGWEKNIKKSLILWIWRYWEVTFLKAHQAYRFGILIFSEGQDVGFNTACCVVL